MKTNILRKLVKLRKTVILCNMVVATMATDDSLVVIGQLASNSKKVVVEICRQLKDKEKT